MIPTILRFASLKSGALWCQKGEFLFNSPLKATILLEILGFVVVSQGQKNRFRRLVETKSFFCDFSFSEKRRFGLIVFWCDFFEVVFSALIRYIAENCGDSQRIACAPKWCIPPKIAGLTGVLS